MEKLIFAKIFEVKKGQVLVTKDFDEDSYLIKVRTELANGVSPTISAGYDSEEERDLQFENYSQEQADTFANSMCETFEK